MLFSVQMKTDLLGRGEAGRTCWHTRCTKRKERNATHATKFVHGHVVKEFKCPPPSSYSFAVFANFKVFTFAVYIRSQAKAGWRWKAFPNTSVCIPFTNRNGSLQPLCVTRKWNELLSRSETKSFCGARQQCGDKRSSSSVSRRVPAQKFQVKVCRRIQA